MNISLTINDYINNHYFIIYTLFLRLRLRQLQLVMKMQHIQEIMSFSVLLAGT